MSAALTMNVEGIRSQRTRDYDPHSIGFREKG